MDIVIPLGTGSRWQNNELRFALRSIEKYLTGYDKIFIIGECPSYLQNIIHIPCPPSPAKRSARRKYQSLFALWSGKAVGKKEATKQQEWSNKPA